MCDCLVGERDDHETEIRSVIFMNTKLKGALAELDIKRNDLLDRSQRLVNETVDCRNQCERSLLQVQALQEQLQNNFKLSHDVLPSGSLDCTAYTQETKQMTGAVHAGTPRSGRVASQHAAPTAG
ncbi:hypothetical protein EVAR_51272_1 [Eumeta japonica]|uniref:Uncharacterized protein n=1 Tax=Eumeta variegata TaxID=151549 RepID=A0A4C1Y9J8_EUMVA|nr:hypothetical protein EVAR_51272_1 [Eumeta japonica]